MTVGTVQKINLSYVSISYADRANMRKSKVCSLI